MAYSLDGTEIVINGWENGISNNPYQGLKINISEKSMTKPVLKNNTLVQLVSGTGGFGMYLDGFILVDELDKILATWLVRTNGKTEGMIKPLVQEQWNLFQRKNLKGELL